MVIEGIVALIWAAISMSFFGGVRELGEVMVAQKGNAAWVVNEISNSLLGKFGAILAILGVVAAPITSGDTAFRSARLTVGDLLRFNQKPIRNRLIITIPLFAVGFLLTKINFDVVWRYFAWSNQTLATVVLWAITVYLFQKRQAFIQIPPSERLGLCPNPCHVRARIARPCFGYFSISPVSSSSSAPVILTRTISPGFPSLTQTRI